MKRLNGAVVVGTLLATVCSTMLMAKDPDARLATVRKAFVVPVDDLADDRPVAACFADHLATHTPIVSVKEKEEADVIFRVKAHLPSATTRVLVGAMGGSPS